LKQGYELAKFCKKEDKLLLTLRSLFGLAVIYGTMDMMNEFYSACDEMQMFLNFYGCGKHQNNHFHTEATSNYSKIITSVLFIWYQMAYLLINNPTYPLL
jgi:hypothetical protein